MQMEALVRKQRRDTLPSHKPGREKVERVYGRMKRGEGGSEQRKRVCTPTCHAQEVPQEVEGRGTVGKRK